MCERTVSAPPPRCPSPLRPRVHAGRTSECAHSEASPSPKRCAHPRAGDAARRIVLVYWRNEPELIELTAELRRHREPIGCADCFCPRSHRGSFRLRDQVERRCAPTARAYAREHTHTHTHTHTHLCTRCSNREYEESGERGARAGRSLPAPGRHVRHRDGDARGQDLRAFNRVHVK